MIDDIPVGALTDDEVNALDVEKPEEYLRLLQELDYQIRETETRLRALQRKASTIYTRENLARSHESIDFMPDTERFRKGEIVIVRWHTFSVNELRLYEAGTKVTVDDEVTAGVWAYGDDGYLTLLDKRYLRKEK